MNNFPAGTAAFHIQAAVPIIESLPHCLADDSSSLFIDSIYRVTKITFGAKLGGRVDLFDEEGKFILEFNHFEFPELMLKHWSIRRNQQWLREIGLFCWEPNFFMFIDAETLPETVHKFIGSLNEDYESLFPPLWTIAACKMIDDFGWFYTSVSEDLGLGVFVASHKNSGLVSNLTSLLKIGHEPVYRLQDGEIH